MSSLANHLESVHNLLGMNVTADWTVIEKTKREATDTGGCFSVTYTVQNKSGQKAFMKVLNLASALALDGDQLKNIQDLISAFNFERDTLDICKKYNLGRVATAILHGKMEIPGNPIGVYYIIFEIAEHGDIRKHLAKLNSFESAWILRTLHQTAIGVFQLHTRGIAHQDIKPSNVLIFKEDGTKVSDLGCADIRGGISPRGHRTYAGDPSYAPIELLYGETSSQWERRRFGADMYLFGSLVTFLFAKVTVTSAIIDRLHYQHRPGIWPMDYQTVLPYVRNAFGEAMVEIRLELPEAIREDLGKIIENLCDPDPVRRGEAGFTGQQQYSFERVASVFNRLAFNEEALITQ